MVFEKIDKMITNELEHSNILMLDEISKSGSGSSYGYGEFNGAIIDTINDCVTDEAVVIICDNVIKFIEYKPSKMENDYYHAIKQKEFPIEFSFSYYVIQKANKNNDYEMLDFQYKRIGKELDRLLKDPYSLCKKEEKGIASAMCTYICESILLAGLHRESIEENQKKLYTLEKIFEIN